MFDSKSDYALTKRDAEAIVCRSANDELVRLTRENFESDDEFLKWKEWSDQDYHITENETHLYYDHSIPLTAAEGVMVSSVESIFLDSLQKLERDKRRIAVLKQLQHKLTDKQYRRLLMYHVQGMTEADIATKEGVSQQQISRSIISGKKIVERFFQEFFDNRV